MARKIIWTTRAQSNRLKIFEYWNNRNKSNTYSRRLNELFKESVKIISRYPLIGKPTTEENVRIKIVRDYLLFYEIREEIIIILMIWDSRQNPKNIKFTF
jgi:toxin YoeB